MSIGRGFLSLFLFLDRERIVIMDNKITMTTNTARTITKRSAVTSSNIPTLPRYISNYLRAEISKASRAGKCICDINITHLLNGDDALYNHILDMLELLGYEVRSSSVNLWNNSYEFTIMWRTFSYDHQRNY